MSEARTSVEADSRQVLAHHARSFRWGAAFLSSQDHDDAAMLYAFCRYADDAVDEAENSQVAEAALDQLEAELEGTEAPRPVVASMRKLAVRRGVSLTAARQLLAGMRSDLTTVRVKTDGELIRYCYLAAGTVGLMMCPVIGVRDKDALAHAVDLGIAMQLTNICRDVLEDAGINRVYIPDARLQAEGTDAEALVQHNAPSAAVAAVVRALLTMADRYYQSGHRGLRYIPWRARFAITIASQLYRQIGVRLRRKHDCDALHGRTIVPPYVKVWCVVKAVGSWIGTLFQRRGAVRHEASLHRHLEGLYPPQETPLSDSERS